MRRGRVAPPSAVERAGRVSTGLSFKSEEFRSERVENEIHAPVTPGRPDRTRDGIPLPGEQCPPDGCAQTKKSHKKSQKNYDIQIHTHTRGGRAARAIPSVHNHTNKDDPCHTHGVFACSEESTQPAEAEPGRRRRRAHKATNGQHDAHRHTSQLTTYKVRANGQGQLLRAYCASCHATRQMAHESRLHRRTERVIRMQLCHSAPRNDERRAHQSAVSMPQRPRDGARRELCDGVDGEWRISSRRCQLPWASRGWSRGCLPPRSHAPF